MMLNAKIEDSQSSVAKSILRLCLSKNGDIVLQYDFVEVNVKHTNRLLA